MRHLSLRNACASLALTAAFTGGLFARQTADLSDERVKERLEFIENSLESARPRAKLWWYGWIAGYSGAAVIQGGLAAANWNEDDGDNHFAQDMLVGGVTCALGSAGLLISPFVPAYGPAPLASLPEDTPEERRAKLVQAEELLRRCAEREKRGRGWLTHGLNLGVNVAAGLVTVFAFDRPWADGLLTLAVNETVSLLNIFSQPRRAQRDLRNYGIRYLGEPGEYREKAAIEWNIGIFPGGVRIGVKF